MPCRGPDFITTGELRKCQDLKHMLPLWVCMPLSPSLRLYSPSPRSHTAPRSDTSDKHRQAHTEV